MNYYQEGYISGKNWKDDSIPGGPWVPAHCPREKNSRMCPICIQDLKNHADWMQGWHDGRKGK